MDAIIVGGGIAGLSCATELHARGKSFVILEASDRVGGRVATDEVDGFKLDRGFQVFLTAYPEAKRVLDYAALQLREFEPGAMVWVDGEIQYVQSGTVKLIDHKAHNAVSMFGYHSDAVPLP